MTGFFKVEKIHNHFFIYTDVFIKVFIKVITYPRSIREVNIDNTISNSVIVNLFIIHES